MSKNESWRLDLPPSTFKGERAADREIAKMKKEQREAVSIAATAAIQASREALRVAGIDAMEIDGMARRALKEAQEKMLEA